MKLLRILLGKPLIQGNYFLCSFPKLVEQAEQKKICQKLRMQVYRAEMSKEQRNAVKLYDRNRKCDERNENSESSRSKLNYHQVLYQSNKIRKLLGNESECHSQVLCHVLRKSLYSPRKQKSISSQCKEFRHFLEVVPKQEHFKTPRKDINNML